mmetsp:Transcript_26998/g.64041  ORF Transcript_26998/g.64041 Transcript_26998/m.64041 type:complete len:206 (-) Transcript_26998:1277-1894(-)
MDQGEGRRRDQPVGRRDPRVRAQGAERQRPRVLPGLARGLPPGGVARHDAAERVRRPRQRRRRGRPPGEPRGGEDSAAVGLQEQVQAREVLEEGPQPAQEPEVDAAQGAGGERHLGGKAGAALEHRQGDHEAAGDPRQVLGREVLQDVRPDIEAARGDAEDEEQLRGRVQEKGGGAVANDCEAEGGARKARDGPLAPDRGDGEAL